MFSKIHKRERISFFSHFIPALIAAATTVYLVLFMAESWQGRLTAMIYGCSVMFLFSASSLYHAKKKIENGRGILRRLDHFAIYVMIAGSYTAICWFYLSPSHFAIIITIQWLMVVAGAYFKIVKMNTPRIISTSIYLAMGWMIVFSIRSIVSAMSPEQFSLLLAGGIAYSVGAIIYALKRPVIIPGFFGFHEIFHLFIVAGAALHFMVVYNGYLAN